MRITVLAVFLLLLTLPVFADQISLSNKIYLNPYTRNSMTAGAMYNYSLAVNPASGVASVGTAIVTFNIYTTPTVNFTLAVNNQSCNTRDFFVSTTFGGAGLYTPSFDCSNVITRAGNYVVSFKSTKDSSTSYGWLDVTYKNNPVGQVKYMGGTDYWSGETATVFLQLQDANANYVNDALCNFDMYNTTNPLLTPIYNKKPMVFRGADGIYYFQFSTAGLPQGVYPLDAECVYSYDNFYYYDSNSLAEPNITINLGNAVTGSPYSINSGKDLLYLHTSSATAGGITGVNTTIKWYNISANVTAMTLIWLGESNNARTFFFYARNLSGRTVFLGSIDHSGTGIAGQPTGEDVLFTAAIPSPMSDFINSTDNSTSVIVFMSGSGQRWDNWITLAAYKNTTYVSEVKGSSEVHIYPSIVSLGCNFTYNPVIVVNTTNLTFDYATQAQFVWNYSTRTLTDYNLSGVDARLGDILLLAQSVNNTVSQNQVILATINGTANQILAVVTDANTTIYSVKGTVESTWVTVNAMNINLNAMNTTLGNTYQNTNQIIATLYNLSVGNITVMANVNVSEIVEGVLGADVQQFVITASPTLASPAPLTGDFLGGVAYAASNGVTTTCVNNSLMSAQTLVRCVNNVCNTVQTNLTEVCQYGCSTDMVPNACIQAPSQINILFMLIVIIGALFLAGGYMYFKGH